MDNFALGGFSGAIAHLFIYPFEYTILASSFRKRITENHLTDVRREFL